MNNIKSLLRAAAFAAGKHNGQKRKGKEGEPYINHPIAVANLLASIGGISNIEILNAALLHDTIEDTATTKEELIENFGVRTAEIVCEVTDDKSLPKLVRKQRQIDHAPHLSDEAKLVKLADKINNVTDVVERPAEDWDDGRRREYVNWGVAVVDGLRGINPALEERFDQIVEQARAKLS